MVLGHLHLEDPVLADVRGQARQALAPATADVDEQHVAALLADDAHDLGDVHDGVVEEHEVHAHPARLLL